MSAPYLQYQTIGGEKTSLSLKPRMPGFSRLLCTPPQAQQPKPATAQFVHTHLVNCVSSETWKLLKIK